MNSKERVLTTLNHQEPDRVPLDLDGWATTISVVTYNELLHWTQTEDTLRHALCCENSLTNQY